MILAGSGHRSRSLGTTHLPDQLILVEFAQHVLRKYGATEAISGMALGWDIAIARAAAREGIPFTAMIPFAGQEKFWPSTDRASYKDLLSRAHSVVVVCGEGTGYRDAYMARNEAMVDRADGILGLWDGRDYGGTFQCLRYAHSKGVRVFQLYQNWMSFRDNRRLPASSAPPGA